MICLKQIFSQEKITSDIFSTQTGFWGEELQGVKGREDVDIFNRWVSPI